MTNAPKTGARRKVSNAITEQGQAWAVRQFMDKGFDRETAEALAFLNGHGQRSLRSL